MAFIWIATMVLTPLRWVNVFLAVMVTLHLLMNYLGELIAGKGTFVDRIKAADIKDAKEITFSQRLKSMPSRLVYSGIVFTMFAYMLAYLIGALVAKSQTAFYVLSDEPTVAVVKQYGSKAVGIRYQGSPPRLTGEYVLLQEAGPNGLRIKLLELGAIAPRRTP
ncbi:MAG: hypothetical protein J0H69_08610 [Burkholderiales bacterium]|nr:hypothetical protein [Burkholderiales bacterium]